MSSFAVAAAASVAYVVAAFAAASYGVVAVASFDAEVTSASFVAVAAAVELVVEFAAAALPQVTQCEEGLLLGLKKKRRKKRAYYMINSMKHSQNLKFCCEQFLPCLTLTLYLVTAGNPMKFTALVKGKCCVFLFLFFMLRSAFFFLSLY